MTGDGGGSASTHVHCSLFRDSSPPAADMITEAYTSNDSTFCLELCMYDDDSMPPTRPATPYLQVR